MLIVVVVAIIVICIWSAFAFLPVLVGWAGQDWTLEQLAHWGESFGPLATLFAAAGFAALIWQIRDGQRAQHRLTFDSNYFELLKLLGSAKENVRFKHSKDYQKSKDDNSRVVSSVRKSGNNAFQAAWNEASFYIFQLSEQPEKDEIRKVYQRYIHLPYESNFGPYFRLMYTILQRVRSDDILDESEKAKYGNLLRSQLNSYELAVLGLNGLASFSANFSELIEYFHLLKYLPRDERREILSVCYSERAFAPRGD